nr:MAG TPA: hypothetical protein [Caudoviricetes sp.]
MWYNENAGAANPGSRLQRRGLKRTHISREKGAETLLFSCSYNVYK